MKGSTAKDEREVFFFGKKRKLNADGTFKVGRMTVQLVRRPGGSWFAELTAYNEDITVSGPLSKSRAAATKKLERRVDSLYRALHNLYETYAY